MHSSTWSFSQASKTNQLPQEMRAKIYDQMENGLAKIRVIVADDNTILRAHIHSLLSRTEDILVVGEAANGLEALRLVESTQADILLLDMEMPVMSGPEVAQRMRASSSPVRILALSAYNDHEYISAMISQGASGYITKDQAPTSIVQAIRLVAKGEQIWFS